MLTRRETVLDRAYWTFETPHFLVTFEPEPEYLDPSDCFESKEDVERASSGNLHDWFCAVVKVYASRDDGFVYEIGSDSLGACSYASFDDFVASHRDRDPMNRNCSVMRAKRGEYVVICHYFPDMVRQAIADARRNSLAASRLRRTV